MDLNTIFTWDEQTKQEILEVFQCCVCLAPPSEKEIWTCTNAHVLCVDCMWHLIDPRCPKCREKYFPTSYMTNLNKNIALTRLYDVINKRALYTCQLCCWGPVTISELMFHKDYCKVQVIPCPIERYYGDGYKVDKCLKLVGMDQLMTHMRVQHDQNYSHFLHRVERECLSLVLNYSQLQYNFAVPMGQHKRPHILKS